MKTLLEVYRMALAENLTAKQASEKYNVNMNSLSKCKFRYCLPSLHSHWDAEIEKYMDKMNDKQLIAYSNVLGLKKNSPKFRKGSFRAVREHKVCNTLLRKRNLLKEKTEPYETKRFAILSGLDSEMTPFATGEWVKYEEYNNLKKENESLLNKVNQISKQYKDLIEASNKK